MLFLKMVKIALGYCLRSPWREIVPTLNTLFHALVFLTGCWHTCHASSGLDRLPLECRNAANNVITILLSWLIPRFNISCSVPSTPEFSNVSVTTNQQFLPSSLFSRVPKMILYSCTWKVMTFECPTLRNYGTTSGLFVARSGKSSTVDSFVVIW